ncbi:MAG: tetratricopeptide repeat protein [Microcystaceae cyanobacterium]
MIKPITSAFLLLGILMLVSGLPLGCTTNSSSIPSNSVNSVQAEEVYQQALEKAKKGDFKAALTDFDQVIQLNPQSAEAYNGRGNTYFVLDKQQEAIKDYTKAIKLNPQLARSYYNRAYAYYRLGDTQKAIKDYNQAIELNPNYPPAYGNRAIVRSQLGDEQGAIEDYTQVIEFQPNLPQAYYNRGTSRSRLGDQPGAIADLQKAAQLFLAQGNKIGYQKAQEFLSQLNE